jgi:hypothetical protein
MSAAHPPVPFAPPRGQATAWPALLALVLLWFVSGAPFRAHESLQTAAQTAGSVVSIVGAIVVGLWAGTAASGLRAVLRSTAGVIGTLFAAMLVKHESVEPATIGFVLGLMLGPILSVPFVYAAAARRTRSAEDFHTASIVAGGWLMCLGGAFIAEEMAMAHSPSFHLPPPVPAAFRLGVALVGGLGLIVTGVVRHHLLLRWLQRVQLGADPTWSIVPRDEDSPPSDLPRILASALHAQGTLVYRWHAEEGPFRDSTAIVPVALAPAASARLALRSSRLRIHGTVARAIVLAGVLGFVFFALLSFGRFE